MPIVEVHGTTKGKALVVAEFLVYRLEDGSLALPMPQIIIFWWLEQRSKAQRGHGLGTWDQANRRTTS